jgi:guanosine-3',5'-bis(diphosphate) 3'-pyrophosphohydrolase
VTDAQLIVEAARTAAEAHSGQLRKGTSGAPYINHPIAVAQMVAGETGDAEVIAAALLHDVVEESETTVADLEAKFGARVARLVADLSDPPEMAALPRPERKRWQAAHIAKASREAQLVKIADQTSNLEDLTREPDVWPPETHAEYRVGAQQVVEACRAVSPTLAARFDQAVEAHARAAQALEART